MLKKKISALEKNVCSSYVPCALEKNVCLSCVLRALEENVCLSDGLLGLGIYSVFCVPVSSLPGSSLYSWNRELKSPTIIAGLFPLCVLWSCVCLWLLFPLTVTHLLQNDLLCVSQQFLFYLVLSLFSMRTTSLAFFWLEFVWYSFPILLFSEVCFTYIAYSWIIFLKSILPISAFKLGHLIDLYSMWLLIRQGIFALFCIWYWGLNLGSCDMR